MNDCPEDWRSVRVAQVGRVITGKTPPTNKPEYWNGDIPFVTPADLNDGVIRRASRSISRQGLAAVKEIPRGAVAVSCIGYIGKVGLIDFDRSATNQQINSVIPSQGYDPQFIAYLFQSLKAELEATASMTTVPILNKANFEDVLLWTPDLPEQRAIAAALRTVQRAKEACEKVIAATRALKQSLLHHLFTYGPVPFDQADRVVLKETEIGMVPEHWHVSRLGDHAIIGNGSTPKRRETRFWEGGTIPWLTSGKVHDSTITYSDEFVTPTARKECHLPLVVRGSIVIAITGQGKTLGNLAKLEIDACVSQHLAYISFRSAEIVPDYALAFLRSRYEQLQNVSRAGGSTKGALTCGFLKGFDVPLPPLAEQRAISLHLSAVDAKLTAEEKRRTALDNLFQSLLHNLMTGRVRVHHLFDELIGADPPVGPVGGAHGSAPLRGADETGGS